MPTPTQKQHQQQRTQAQSQHRAERGGNFPPTSPKQGIPQIRGGYGYGYGYNRPRFGWRWGWNPGWIGPIIIQEPVPIMVGNEQIYEHRVEVGGQQYGVSWNCQSRISEGGNFAMRIFGLMMLLVAGIIFLGTLWFDLDYYGIVYLFDIIIALVFSAGFAILGGALIQMARINNATCYSIQQR
jgi:hypothetical protein